MQAVIDSPTASDRAKVGAGRALILASRLNLDCLRVASVIKRNERTVDDRFMTTQQLLVADRQKVLDQLAQIEREDREARGADYVDPPTPNGHFDNHRIDE
jgi:hypothetical protein